MATTNFTTGTVITSDWANDVDRVIYDSDGANYTNWKSAGTGSTSRSLVNKLDEFVSVKDFGAIGDGSTDDTTAIQAAIIAAQTAGGGRVYFPADTYKITGKLSITDSGIHLVGDGIEATILYFDNGTSDCIEAYGTDTGANQLNGFSVKEMSIKHGTKTAGRTFVISYAYKVNLENLYVENCWTGLEAYITNNCDVKNVSFQGVLGGGNAPTYLGPVAQAPLNCYGIFWHAPSDGSSRSDALRLINVTVQASFSGADGLLWDGGATTLDAYQFTALSCDYGIRIRNTGLSNTNYPQYGEFHNVNTDGAKSIGCYIEAGSTFHFNSCNIGNTSGITDQGNADTNALKILPDESGSFTRNLQFVNCNFTNCREDTVSANARDMQFTGCVFHDGGKAAANTYSGLLLGADAEDVVVSGCKFNLYGSNNNYKYGINIAAGSVRILVDGNFIYNAQTKPINCLSTDSYTRIYNTGHNAFLHGDFDTYINPTAVDMSGGNVNLTAAQVLGGVCTLSGATAARDATTPTAAQIIAGLQNPFVGLGVPLMLISANSYAITMKAGSGVTFSGLLSGSDFVIPITTTRMFYIRPTNLAAGTEAVTIYG